MPETDVLNPVAGYDATLGDSMNWNFNFLVKRQNSWTTKKTAGGRPYSRESENVGHQLQLSWLNRTLACVRKLRWYYHRYSGSGFFTIIDHDNNGRQYVGHFTGDLSIKQTANGRYDVELTFEEIAGAPMAVYPGDWANDAIICAAFDDYGDQMLATSGSWAKSNHTVGGAALVTMDSSTAGDTATYEYLGYGFRLRLLTGPAYGQCNIYLDDVQLNSAAIDCYAAADAGSTIVLTQQTVSLDFHRVKVQALGAKNASATGATIAWHQLEVMR